MRRSDGVPAPSEPFQLCCRSARAAVDGRMIGLQINREGQDRHDRVTICHTPDTGTLAWKETVRRRCDRVPVDIAHVERGDAETYPGVGAWLGVHDARALEVLERTRLAPGVLAGSPVVSRRGPTWRALPWGRLPYSHSSPSALTHSLIGAGAFDHLRRMGWVGVTDVAQCEFTNGFAKFHAAYDWVRWQMVQSIPGYTGRYPMWVWTRTSRSQLIKQLRVARRQQPGDVLLTMLIPREQIFVTDFDAWHLILMGSPATPTVCPTCATRHCTKDDCWNDWHDAWDQEWTLRSELAGAQPRAGWWTWPAPLRAELFDTWKAVADIAPEGAAQGCVEIIHAAWVTAAYQVD